MYHPGSSKTLQLRLPITAKGRSCGCTTSGSGQLPSCLESLEDRTMLSLSIPASIDPTQATQVLLAGDVTQESLPAGTPTRLWAFSLNGATSPASIEFDLSPTSTSTQDGALALYDADGNLLTSANTNSNPAAPGVESLVAPVQSGQVYILGTFFLTLPSRRPISSLP